MNDEHPSVLLVGTHTHVCDACKELFPCKEDSCDVEEIARINGTGPFCMLCWHLLWAIRLSRGVSLTLRIEHLEQYERRQRPNGRDGTGPPAAVAGAPGRNTDTAGGAD